MLDVHRLHSQIEAFRIYRQQEEQRLRARRAAALEAFAACAADWQGARDRAEEALRRGAWRGLVAELCGPPDACAAAPPPPRPLTAVATDGSQIYPDRHVEPTCYLLNIARVAFHYGTEEPPLLRAEPDLRYRARDLDDLRAEEGEAALLDLTAEVVAALRDEQELRWLLETARDERRPGRPVVALADGTLIRWMLRGLKRPRLEEALLARYLDVLEGFRYDGIPLASYVSMPGNTELVSLLRLLRGEAETEEADDSIRGVLDRHLFEAILAPGERSALFVSGSHIQRYYGSEHRIAYFYIRHEQEVGRVEVPAWVAREPALLDLLHAALLDECRKGGGYPMILTEAHQRAVIRAPERALFYRILERQMTMAGLHGLTGSQKAAAKRIPRI